jgi:hypothetical protein
MEKRAFVRHSELKAGTLQFDGGSINCVVRDWSNAGAMLHVPSSVGIPERCTLIMSPDGRHMFCRIAWRTDKRIGVEFELSPPQTFGTIKGLACWSQCREL